MLLKLSNSTVATLLTLWACAVSAARYSLFAETCTDIEYSDGELVASCTNATVDGVTPNQHSSSLDLNLCLGFSVDLGLSWEIYGKFSEDCPLCDLQGVATFFTCNCTSLNGITVGNATINLNDGISNDGGVLTCMGGIGN